MTTTLLRTPVALFGRSATAGISGRQPQASTSGSGTPNEIRPLATLLCRLPTPRRRRISPHIARAFAHSYAERPGCHKTYERVLRYPDGVRVLRYPAPCDEDINAQDTGDSWETRNVSKLRARRTSGPPSVMKHTFQAEPTKAVSSPSASAPSSADAAADAAATSTPVPSDSLPSSPSVSPTSADSIPTSPLALLRMLTSPKRKQAQRQEWEELCDSFTVLHGCPWPVPRPLFVLATPQQGRDAPLTHTLRTLLPRGDVEAELTRLLGNRKRPSGKPLISCGEVVDGVIAFEEEDAAREYGRLLEENGNVMMGRVAMAECDSHELFRGIQDARAVMVLMKRGAKVPLPHQLASAVRGRSPFEEEEGEGDGGNGNGKSNPQRRNLKN